MADNNTHDWKQIHDDLLAEAPIPALSQESAGATGPWELRDLRIDLADVYARIAKADAKPLVVTLAADVVTIPAGYASLNLSGTALLITARRIEIADPPANSTAPLGGRAARITLRYDGANKLAKLILFCTELSGSLHIVAPTGSGTPTEWVLSAAPASVGVQYTYKGTAPAQTAIAQLPSDLLDVGSPARLSLGSIFQLATAAFSSDTALTTDLLNWVSRATSSTTTATDLHFQASALLQALNSENAAGFVPTLSRSFYADQSTAFIGAVESFFQQYQRYTDQGLDLAARLEAAKLSLAQYDDASTYADGLIDQAQSNYDRAIDAVQATHHSLLTQKDEVARCQAVFETSLAAWKKDQQTAQIIAIVTGVIKLIAGVVGMVAKFGVGVNAAPSADGEPTDPTSNAALGGGVLSPEQLAVLRNSEPFKTDYAKYLTALEAFKADLPKKTYECAAGIGEAIERVTMAFEAAQAMADAVEKMQNAAGLEAADVSMLQPSISPDDPSGDARWQAMQVEADAAIQTAIDAGVPDSVEYKVAVDLEVVYGRAVTTCQLAVIRTSQELVRLRLQKRMAEQQKARLQGYIDGLASNTVPVEQLAQEMYDRTLDIKRWFFLSISDYKKAFEYWALRPSLVSPSMVKDVPELKADLATITREYGLALKAFRPPPQPFTISRSFTDPAKLSAFRSTRSVVLPIALTDPAFGGRSRVRIRTMRAWLRGATFTGSVDLMLSNTGLYADRLGPRTFQFISEPLQRGFSYQANGSIVLDGQIFDEEQYAYFMPTPFTDWTVALAPNVNASLVLSGLTEIKLDFEGSAILL